MKFYVTTAIDYVNAPPHIGHALEKLQADVLARDRRRKGDEVFFLTGTDEHGAKIVRAADAAKKTPQELVDETAGKFKTLKKALNLSFDDFIRTTDKERHWPAVRLMWQKLADAGDIYKKTYKGLYCVGHEAFVTKKDLVDGKCADHGTAPEAIEEENYFFRLSKYGEEIAKRIKGGELEIVPASRANEIFSLAEEGLEDVSFSRPREDLSWGIPVPGDETQTIYVWCDALVNYLSAIGFGDLSEDEIGWWSRKGRYGTDPRDLEREIAKRFFTLWPADVHLIGKDILRFHAAIWPGMLLSAGLPLPKKIYVHGFITVEGEKMSKTVGNIVDPLALVRKYGTDAVRYYFLREVPTTEDGDWSEGKFLSRYNGDLANGLGNFAARVLALCDAKLRIHANAAKATSDVPNIEVGPKDIGRLKVEQQIEARIKQTREVVARRIEEFRLHEALEAIWGLIHFGDQYVNEKKPWEESLSANRRSQAVFNLVVVLDNVAALLAPFLPEAAEKITRSIVWDKGGLRVKKIEPLFPRFTSSQDVN